MSIEKLYGCFLQEDVTDKDLGEPEIDRELTEKFVGKHRGSVRISTGRFYTKAEWAERREKLLRVKLPG